MQSREGVRAHGRGARRVGVFRGVRAQGGDHKADVIERKGEGKSTRRSRYTGYMTKPFRI